MVNEKNCPAGWGIAIYNEEGEEIMTGLFGPVETKHNNEHFLGAEFGSNNTGELTAICEGLKWIIENDDSTKPIAFYYDSKYAAKITTGEYKAESNKYLAAKARTLLQQALNKRKIRFEHIKGHSNDKGNDAADELANKGAEGQTCRTLEQWNNIKHTHPETSNKEKEKDKEKEDRDRLNNIRLAEIRIQERDRIQIPIPSYGYGATRRSRFAFGRITANQARTNTAKQQKQNTVEITHTENTFHEIEEPEEEDLFKNDEEPNNDDCA